MKRSFFVLLLLVFSSYIFADELDKMEKVQPAITEMESELEKPTRRGKRRKQEDGWQAVGVLFSKYGISSPGDKEDDFLCFPFVSLAYRQGKWEVGMEGLGIAGKYNPIDEIELVLAGIVGWKREGRTFSQGYQPGVINNANYKLGVAAYFLRAEYTYFPVNVIHPPIKNHAMDAHFLELSLKIPGFPLMVKPRFWGIGGKLNLSVMDDHYAQAYFNFYDSNGFPIYQANGGLHSFSYSLTSNLVLSSKWLAFFSFKREFYLSDACDSPITEKATENKLTFMIMYSF